MLARGRISPVSVTDSVQPSTEVIAGQSEMLQSQKHMSPWQIFAKASGNKALVHWYGAFPFFSLLAHSLLLAVTACCLQNCGKLFGDFLSACSTN